MPQGSTSFSKLSFLIYIILHIVIELVIPNHIFTFPNLILSDFFKYLICIVQTPLEGIMLILILHIHAIHVHVWYISYAVDIVKFDYDKFDYDSRAIRLIFVSFYQKLEAHYMLLYICNRWA